jgi:hypothetical protein
MESHEVLAGSHCISVKIIINSALIFLICLATSVPLQAVEPSEQLLARFEAEAPEAWKLLEFADETPGTIKVTVEVATFSAGKLANDEHKEAILRRKPGFSLFEPLQSRGGGRIFQGKNPGYSYSITKEDDKDGFALAELQLAGQPGFAKISLDMYDYVKPNSYSFLPMHGLLSEVVAKPRFKILRAADAEVGLIRLDFKTAILLPGQEVELTGWMLLNPKNSWAQESCEYQTFKGNHIKIVKHFLPSKRNGYRPCESWEAVERSGKDSDWEMRHETKFEILDALPPDDEVFTLSHFSLPEPMGFKPPQRPRAWLWLLVAAAGLAALAVLFASLKRRAAQRRVKAQPTQNRDAV